MPNDLPDWTAPGQILLVDTATAVVPGTPVTHNGVQLPAGTQTLIVLAVDSVSSLTNGHVGVVGGTSGNPYLGNDLSRTFPTTVPFGGIVYIPSLPVDDTVNITYDGESATSVNFWVFATPTPLQVAIESEIGVALQNGSGVLLDTRAEFSTADVQSVSLSQSFPPPWLAPAGWVTFNSQIASGATLTIVSAVTGVQLFLHALTMGDDGANAAARYHLQDTASTDVEIVVTVNTRGVKLVKDMKGLPMTPDLGIKIRNNGAAASFISGSLSYYDK